MHDASSAIDGSGFLPVMGLPAYASTSSRAIFQAIYHAVAAASALRESAARLVGRHTAERGMTSAGARVIGSDCPFPQSTASPQGL